MSTLSIPLGTQDITAQPSGRIRLAVYAICTCVSIAYTFYAGRDLNWDALNYHLYAGFSAFNDRFQQDFFAAGPQAYLNPYGHAPFYLMVKANWPSAIIGGVFATLHSVNLWLTYEMALLLGRNRFADSSFVALVAVLLAFLNPVFLQELGSSFNDISTGAFALGGWLALMYSFRSEKFGTLIAAGALLGIAAALKLSNVIFALAAFPALLLVPASSRTRLAAATAFVAALACSFIVIAGPWAWRLWKEFGNPFFPMFNEIFRSPDFITEPMKQLRFVPESWLDAVSLPFRMVLPLRLIHTEASSPDIRYAVVFCLLVVSGLLLLNKALARVGLGKNTAIGQIDDKVVARSMWALVLGFVTSWILWLISSGNSRYFIPMACVASVLVAVLLERLFARRRRILVYLTLLLIGIQLTQVALGMNRRWNKQEWDGPWVPVTVPERYRDEAYLFLSVDVLSSSFLAPFVSPQSGFISTTGNYVIGPGGPGGAKAEALIARNKDRLRMLFPVRTVRSDGKPLPPNLSVFDARVRRFGLQVDGNDCDYLQLQGALNLLEITSPGIDRVVATPATNILTCKLVSTDVDLAGYAVAKQGADIVFNRVEDACPNLFQPRRSLSEMSGSTWRRIYMNTDIQLWIADGSVEFLNPIQGGSRIQIGREVDWARSAQPIDCSKSFGLAFGLFPRPH